MEPNKLIAAVWAVVAAFITTVLFVIEYDKIKAFFFPAKTSISLALFIACVIIIILLSLFVGYYFYHKEIEKHKNTIVQLENTKSLLLDSERLRLVDFVTGIPNEAKFKLDLNSRPKELFHLIIIDLDNFSLINKKQGFQKGDDVIRTIAQDLFIKMRRDEEIYKLSYRVEENFVKRVYRKYTGGDEFIFLIKGPQYEAVGFITRVQKQMKELSKHPKISNLGYDIKFHAAIVSLYPNDTYDIVYDKLQRAYVQAAEGKDGLSVFWDKDVENELPKNYDFIYSNARKAFAIDNQV